LISPFGTKSLKLGEPIAVVDGEEVDEEAEHTPGIRSEGEIGFDPNLEQIQANQEDLRQ
jgi:hypothetical protein